LTELGKQQNILTGQMLNKSGAMQIAAAKGGPLPLDAAGHAALQGVRDAERARDAAQANLAGLDPQRERVKRAAEAREERRQRLAQARKEFRDSARTAVVGAGGAIGAGIGLQMGQDAIKGIQKARIDEAVQHILAQGVRTADGTRAATEAEVRVAVETKDFSGLSEAGKTIAEAVVANIQPVSVWQQIGITIGAAAVGQFLGATIFGAVGSIMGAAAGAAWVKIQPIATAIWKAMGTAWVAIQLAALAVWNSMRAAWVAVQPIASAAFAVFTRAWVAIQAVAGAVFGAAIVAWPVVLAAALVAAAVLMSTIWKDKVQAAVTWMADKIRSLWDSLKTAVKSAFEGVYNWFTNDFPTIVFNAFKKFFTSDAGEKAMVPKGTPAAQIPRTIVGKADGGRVSGPGGPRSDSILTWLSNGEFVINAKSTGQYLPLLEAINANKFADGGAVGRALQGSQVKAGDYDLRYLNTVMIGSMAGQTPEVKAQLRARNVLMKASVEKILKLREGYLAAMKGDSSLDFEDQDRLAKIATTINMEEKRLEQLVSNVPKGYRRLSSLLPAGSV
jgi:hypothetical protein